MMCSIIFTELEKESDIKGNPLNIEDSEQRYLMTLEVISVVVELYMPAF